MTDLLLPDQLQLLLESPEDGEVPVLLYGLVRDCVQTGLAWEIARQGAVILQGKTARKGTVWPPGLGELDALAHTLVTPDHLQTPMNACMFVRQLHPESGLITEFLGRRLADRHLLDTKQVRHLLFLSKLTHPVSDSGRAQIDALQKELQATLADLASPRIDAASREPRVWMLAVLLDTFSLLDRAVPGHPHRGRTASSEAVKQLVDGGVMSPEFARLAFDVANTADRPASWFDVVGAGLDLIPGN